MNSGIYAITNKENGKAYVGSTTRLKRRQSEHKDALRHSKHGNLHLQFSWDKYGESVFEFIVCEYVDDQKHLVKREQYWLDFYRMYVDVYNTILMVDRSSGMLGKKHSEETRQRMSVSARNRPLGYKHTEEAKCKIGAANTGELNPNYGRVYTEEERDRLSKAHTGKILTEEHKHNISQGLLNMDSDVAAERSRKLSEAGKGRVCTAETRDKLSKLLMGNQNALGHKHSEEARCNISQGLQDMSPEAKAERSRKQSEAAKARGYIPLSEESRRRLSKSNTGKVRTEEHRSNMSKAQLARRARERDNGGIPPCSEEHRRKLSESGKRAWIKRRAMGVALLLD